MIFRNKNLTNEEIDAAFENITILFMIRNDISNLTTIAEIIAQEMGDRIQEINTAIRFLQILMGKSWNINMSLYSLVSWIHNNDFIIQDVLNFRSRSKYFIQNNNLRH